MKVRCIFLPAFAVNHEMFFLGNATARHSKILNAHLTMRINNFWWWEGVGPRYTIIKIYKNSWGQKLRFYDFSNCVFSYWCCACARTDPSSPTLQNKNTHIRGYFHFGGSGWIRTTSGLSQQIYSLPRLSNSGARPELNFCGLPHEAFGEVWCGQRDSNPHIKLGRLAY